MTTEQPDTRIYSGGPVSQGFAGLRGGTQKYDPSTEGGVNVPPTEKPFEKPDYRDTQPEPEIITEEVDLYVPPTEKPFEKPDYRDTQPEPEVTTDHIEPPSEDQDFLPPTSQVEPPIEEPVQVTTSQIDPPGVEEPEVITSQVEPPGQEVTAEISWFGNTWFPWHLELEDRRRR